MPNFIGIDPGLSGGIAWKDSNWPARSYKMPATDKDLHQMVSMSVPADKSVQCFAIVELVTGWMPGSRAVTSQMFKLGKNYGAILMALTSLNIPFEVVMARVWQKALGIARRKKGESDNKWKNRLKSKAQQLYPKVNVTLATADALLILEYCRRKHGRMT